MMMMINLRTTTAATLPRMPAPPNKGMAIPSKQSSVYGTTWMKKLNLTMSVSMAMTMAFGSVGFHLRTVEDGHEQGGVSTVWLLVEISK